MDCGREAAALTAGEKAHSQQKITGRGYTPFLGAFTVGLMYCDGVKAAASLPQSKVPSAQAGSLGQ